MRKKIKIKEAYSMQDGIAFLTSKRRYQIVATIDDEGKITTEIRDKKAKKKRKKETIAKRKQKNRRILKQLLVILPIVFVLCVMWIQLLYKDIMGGIQAYMVGYPTLFLVLFLIKNIPKKREKARIFKFHSAEHMVINGYDKLKRVPTIDEIRNYSRFNKNCGTNHTTITVILFYILGLCMFISPVFYRTFVQVVLILLTNILLITNHLNFLQRITTVPPTDAELSVAIKGLNTWLEYEKEIRNVKSYKNFISQNSSI